MRVADHGHGDVLPVGLDGRRGEPRRSGRRGSQDHGIPAAAGIAGGQLPDRPRTTLFQREGVGAPPDPDLLPPDLPRLAAFNQGQRNGYAVVVGVGDLHFSEDVASIGEEPGAEDGGIGVDQQPAPRRCPVARGVDRLDLEQVRPLLQNRLRAAPRFSTALQYPGSFPLRAIERQAVPGQSEEVEIGAQGPARRDAEAIEAHLVAVGVGDRSVARRKPLDPVHEQAVAEGGQLVGRGVGAVVPLDGDPDPSVHPHRTGGGEFSRSVRAQLQRNGVGASVHAAAVVHRHQCDPLQGRRLRVGYGVVVEQRIDRDVAGVADLQVQVRRSRSAFAAARDHLPARNRELSFLQPEIDGVAAGFLLRRTHPPLQGRRERLEVGVDYDAAVAELLIHGAAEPPGRGADAGDVPGGDCPHLVPGPAPGLQVDAGVERGRAGFAEGRGEGGVEVERPQEGRFGGGQAGTGGEKYRARGDRPPDEIRAQAGCRPPGKGPEPAVRQTP